MKRILIYVLCLAVVLFSVWILIGGRINRLGRQWAVSYEISNTSYGYGDYYKITDLNDFKIRIDKVSSPELHTATSAQILLMGDSFFYAKNDSEVFANGLEKKIDKTAYKFPDRTGVPIPDLKSLNYKKGDSKIFILETVERYTLKRAATYRETDPPTTALSFRDKVNKLCRDVFDGKDMEYFFRHNFLIYPLRQWLINWKYRYLGMVDYRILARSFSPKMLFNFEEVVFAREEIKDEGITKAADNIKFLADKLKKDFNLDLVYMIMPNAYSIYYKHDASGGGSYNNFIPRLHEELKKRGVKFADVYSRYRNFADKSDNPPLYYANDSHFVPLGKSIAIDEVAKVLGAK